MSDFESSYNFENIDPADFIEPTPETRALLADVVQSLKQLVAPVVVTPDQILGDYGTEVLEALSLKQEDLSPITAYYYDQMSDPLFSMEEPTYLAFKILNGEPGTFENWECIFGEAVITALYYQNETDNLDINYSLRFSDESLYITQPTHAIVDELDLERLEEIKQEIEEQLNDKMAEAYDNGATQPTDGGMRKLIEGLKQEIAKRITE